MKFSFQNKPWNLGACLNHCLLGIESVNPVNPFFEFHITIGHGIDVLQRALKQFNDGMCNLVDETIRGNTLWVSQFSPKKRMYN
jgi:hypothetical protein